MGLSQSVVSLQPGQAMLELIDSDFSHIEGTDCYCSDEAAQRIRLLTGALPLRAVHFLGNGDYHHVSLFWLERIGGPFELMLFDNHPDDQPCTFGDDLLSCGSWVIRARALPFCKAVRWLDGNGVWHRTETGREDAGRSGGTVIGDLPVYLSVDLDILAPECIRTNWNQGSLTVRQLIDGIACAIRGRTVIGADVCGGPAPDDGDFGPSLELARQICAMI